MYVIDTHHKDIYGPLDLPGMTILVAPTKIQDVTSFQVWDALTANLLAEFSILGSYVIEPVITPPEVDTVFEDYTFVGWAIPDEI